MINSVEFAKFILLRAKELDIETEETNKVMNNKHCLYQFRFV
jgi:hypothetical protein